MDTNLLLTELNILMETIDLYTYAGIERLEVENRTVIVFFDTTLGDYTMKNLVIELDVMFYTHPSTNNSIMHYHL